MTRPVGGQSHQWLAIIQNANLHLGVGDRCIPSPSGDHIATGVVETPFIMRRGSGHRPPPIRRNGQDEPPVVPIAVAPVRPEKGSGRFPDATRDSGYALQLTGRQLKSITRIAFGVWEPPGTFLRAD